MKRFIAALVVCVGLILATPTNAYIPVVEYESADDIPAMTGTLVGDQLACFADDLTTETKATLNRWRELNAKREAGTITEEELAEGGKLAIHQHFNPETFEMELHGQCGVLPDGIPVTVKLLDGLDYFVQTEDGQMFIVKGDTFQQD